MDKSYIFEAERNTLETQIKMTIDASENHGFGFKGSTGIGSFDHMLHSFAIHSGLKIDADIKGDICVDCHHTIEDTGIVLGSILSDIVKVKSPVVRYGTAFIPMDEALARCVIDLSGRPYLVMNYTPKAPMIGEYDTQMTVEFFRAVAYNLKATVHIELLYGQNEHHAVEAIFKSFAHALKDAWQTKNGEILSAKGVL